MFGIRDYVKFEIKRYKSFSIKEIIISLSILIAYLISFFYAFIFYMNNIVPSYITTRDKLEENIGKFYFIHSNCAHLFIFYSINIIAYLIYSFKLVPDSCRIQKVWPWERELDENQEKKTLVDSIENPDWPRLKSKTIITFIINHLVIVPLLTLPNLYLNRCIFSVSSIDFDNDITDYLSFDFIFKELIPQVLFCMITEDFCFYWGHYFLHKDFLYKYIHKQHHEYKSTVTWTSEYAHPLEYIFGNILPTISGPLILGKRMRVITNTFFLFNRIIKTSEAHSGYYHKYSFFKLLPFTNSPEAHNYHHDKFKGNYGSFLTHWDFLFGTFNKLYVEHFIIPGSKLIKEFDDIMMKKIY